MRKEVNSIEYTVSCGNIFTDMGLEDADELLLRAKLGYTIRKILEGRNLKQQEIAELYQVRINSDNKIDAYTNRSKNSFYK